MIFCNDLGTCICEGIDPDCVIGDEDEVSAKETPSPEKTPEDLFEDALTEPPPLHKVLGEVEQERLKQDQKWGAQNYQPPIWLIILGEEVGEANKAALEAHFSHVPQYPSFDESIKNYRKELIQVAAVAVAAVESLDRNELAKAQSEDEPVRVPCEKCADGIIGHECIENCLCQDGYMDCWECDGNGYKEVK